MCENGKCAAGGIDIGGLWPRIDIGGLGRKIAERIVENYGNTAEKDSQVSGKESENGKKKSVK